MSGGLRRPDFVDALLPTMVALIVYRAGLMIPIPGLEPNALPHLAHNGASAYLPVTGGATARHPGGHLEREARGAGRA